MHIEEKIEYALDCIFEQGLRHSGHPIFPIREAARIFKVPKSTLTDRWNGGKSRKQGHEAEMKLKSGEEAALSAWIIEMGRRGIPMRNNFVCRYAEAISGKTVGDI